MYVTLIGVNLINKYKVIQYMEFYSPEKDIEIYYQISGNENGPKMVLIHGHEKLVSLNRGRLAIA